VTASDGWKTLREFGPRLDDVTAGQVKAAIQSLSLGPRKWRGEGDAREYSPDAQLAIIQALRTKALEARSRRST
jgi:hypothetical protein